MALPAILLAGGMLASVMGLDDQPQTDWRLVGAYDITSALALAPETRTGYVWVPSTGMNSSCGPAKAPDGMGMFEAELVANGMTPALAIVLKYTGEDPHPLNSYEVLVSLGDGEPQHRLQPAVIPRHVAARIEGAGKLRYKQLVRTQLEMELCLEHKVGRGWTGGDVDGLREAFLLDPPHGRSDRKFFGGQTDPAPPLLGPPDACLKQAAGFNTTSATGGQGEGHSDLVPSDIWGSSLRWCRSSERGGLPITSASPDLDFLLHEGLTVDEEEGTGPIEVPPDEPLVWNDLEIEVGPGEADKDVPIAVRYNGATVWEGPLYSEIPGEDGGESVLGITDVLARIPHLYPAAGPPDDPWRYVLLIVPDWQILEAARRLRGEGDVEPWPAASGSLSSGTSFVLENPETLFVQVQGEGGEWLDLTDVMSGGLWGLLDWGYTAGLVAGREPIALPTENYIAWGQSASAQRALPHGVFLASFGVVLFALLAGLRRLSDLWIRVPEERANYWPGKYEEEGDFGGDDPNSPGGMISDSSE